MSDLNAMHNDTFRPSWRDYQYQLKKTDSIRQKLKQAIKYLSLAFVMLIVGYGAVAGLGHYAEEPIANPAVSGNPKNKEAQSEAACHKNVLTKQEIQNLVDTSRFDNLQQKEITLDYKNEKCQVVTSLDIELQNYILKNLDRSTAKYIAFVAMEPDTGRVLSMVSFDKTKNLDNPCTVSKYPAASIFKIVTAAAVIKECGLKPNSSLTFNGGKYTLYKRQLREKKNRYSNRITFKDSFAQSVNPIFGKFGANYLGKESLEKYAKAFGFNQHINFELPLDSSHVSVEDDPYQWAEIASGFNRETLISPVHGALMVATIINDGVMIEPTIIDRIEDNKGEVLYSNKVVPVKQVIDPGASHTIQDLMKRTIVAGTCRKSFRRKKRDKVLSKLIIGGKTGTIFSKYDNDLRYDWFVGFAETSQGQQKIVVSVVVAHDKYIGTRASQYAKLAMKNYFGQYFAKTKAANASIGADAGRGSKS